MNAQADLKKGTMQGRPVFITRWPVRWCRSDELDTEEGVLKFAAYLVDFMHGPGAQNDRQYVPKPNEDVTIGALGEGATALYKTAVRARADA